MQNKAMEKAEYLQISHIVATNTPRVFLQSGQHINRNTVGLDILEQGKFASLSPIPFLSGNIGADIGGVNWIGKESGRRHAARVALGVNRSVFRDWRQTRKNDIRGPSLMWSLGRVLSSSRFRFG
jgi:hypothetical protein